MCVRERERESVFVCVCVREKEGESVQVPMECAALSVASKILCGSGDFGQCRKCQTEKEEFQGMAQKAFSTSLVLLVGIRCVGPVYRAH